MPQSVHDTLPNLDGLLQWMQSPFSLRLLRLLKVYLTALTKWSEHCTFPGTDALLQAMQIPLHPTNLVLLGHSQPAVFSFFYFAYFA